MINNPIFSYQKSDAAASLYDFSKQVTYKSIPSRKVLQMLLLGNINDSYDLSIEMFKLANKKYLVMKELNENVKLEFI